MTATATHVNANLKNGRYYTVAFDRKTETCWLLETESSQVGFNYLSGAVSMAEYAVIMQRGEFSVVTVYVPPKNNPISFTDSVACLYAPGTENTPAALLGSECTLSPAEKTACYFAGRFAYHVSQHSDGFAVQCPINKSFWQGIDPRVFEAERMAAAEREQAIADAIGSVDISPADEPVCMVGNCTNVATVECEGIAGVGGVPNVCDSCHAAISAVPSRDGVAERKRDAEEKAERARLFMQAMRPKPVIE